MSEGEYDQIPVRDNICICSHPLARTLDQLIGRRESCTTCGNRFPPQSPYSPHRSESANNSYATPIHPPRPICTCERVQTRALTSAAERGDFCPVCGFQLALTPPLQTPPSPLEQIAPEYEDIGEVLRNFHARHPQNHGLSLNTAAPIIQPNREQPEIIPAAPRDSNRFPFWSASSEESSINSFPSLSPPHSPVPHPLEGMDDIIGAFRDVAAAMGRHSS